MMLQLAIYSLPQIRYLILREMRSGHYPLRCPVSPLSSFFVSFSIFLFFLCRLLLKYDGTRAEIRFRLSAKRTSPFKSAGASVQSTTGSQGVSTSGSNAGYTMFRGGVKGTGYTLYSPVSPSLPHPCVTVCHHISTGLYFLLSFHFYLASFFFFHVSVSNDGLKFIYTLFIIFVPTSPKGRCKSLSSSPKPASYLTIRQLMSYIYIYIYIWSTYS